MGKTIGGVDYTTAQCVTIALAELASALGARLPREAAGWEDWAVVEFLTAHVRGERAGAPEVTATFDVCGGSAGTASGDMAAVGLVLRSSARCTDEVVGAFNRTLERVRLLASPATSPVSRTADPWRVRTDDRLRQLELAVEKLHHPMLVAGGV